MQREEVAYKMPHRARVRLGKGKPRTVRENNRQGKGEGEDTRLFPYVQHVQDGGDYTPEMGLARAAGALRGENRAERPGTKKAKCLKCDNFTSENDKCSHLQEKGVFLEVAFN